MLFQREQRIVTPRSEELWSYLIGRAPFGSPVVLMRDEIGNDLRLYGKAISNALRELVSDRAIRRLGPNLFEVRRRIGAHRRVPYAGRALPAKGEGRAL